MAGPVPYLSQRVGVHHPGAMGFAKAMLPAAGSANGRVLRPPQGVVPTHGHGDRSRRAAAALWAVEGRGQTLTSSQQQVSGAEVTRHWWRTALHHAPVAMAVAVVRAAEGAAEQTFGALPSVAVNRKWNGDSGGSRRSSGFQVRASKRLT